MEPVSTIAGLVGSTVKIGSSIYAYTSSVKNAKKSALQLERETRILEQALEELKTALARNQGPAFDETSILFQTTNGCKAELEPLQSDLSKLREGTRIRRLFHQLKWPLDEADTLKAIEALHRYSQIFQLSLTTAGFDLLSRSCSEALEKIDNILDSSSEIQVDILEVKRLLAPLSTLPQKIDDLAIDSQFSGFLDWFPTFNFQERHLDIQIHRLEGSGQWLLDSSSFKEWFERSSNATLFCQGGPGVGKSYLTSIVIDHLLQLSAARQYSVAYCYFDYKSQSLQTPMLVLSCLLKQILSQYPSIPKSAKSLFGRFKKRQGLPSWKEMLDTLIELVSSSRIYVLLDALDECEAGESRGKILELAQRLRKCGIQLFATSRPFPEDVLDAFAGSIIVDMEASGADLKEFLLKKIDEDKRLKRLMTENLRDEITATIVPKSKGMFLLAAMQIDYVLGQTSEKNIKVALTSLPVGLVEYYNFIIEDRIKGLPLRSQVEFAFQTLLWISTATRVMSVDELRHAISASPNCLKFDPTTLPAGNLFVEYCFGLVVIEPTSSIVRLAHYSIHEYLKQRQSGLFPQANASLALGCITYLMYSDFGHSVINMSDDDENSLAIADITTSFPFLSYAVEFWGVHAAKDFNSVVRAQVIRFLNSGGNFSFWVHLDYKNNRESRDADFQQKDKRGPSNLTWLHIAARFGLLKLLDTSSQRFAEELNSFSSRGDTPLMIAAEYGHDQFVQLLLDKQDIILNAIDIDGFSALTRAIAGRRVSTVRLLLGSAGINVNIGAPIKVALITDQFSTLPELLNHPKLDFNAVFDVFGETILYNAVIKARVDCIQSLLQHPNLLPSSLAPSNKTLESLLTIISEEEDLIFEEELRNLSNIIKLLAGDFWRRGRADPGHAYLKWFWKWIVSRSSHIDLYLGWLDHGMDSTMVDENGDSLLHIGVENKSQTGLSQELFDRGFNLDLVNKKGQTPLQFAAFYGNNEMIKFLAGLGAKLITFDNEGWTALHHAVFQNHIETVRLLLEMGIGPNTFGDSGWTPLHEAVGRGHRDIAELLLEHGANPMAVDTNGWTTLLAAARGEDLEIVKKLLILGVRPNQASTAGDSPLSEAVWSQDNDLVLLLLQNGAKIAANPVDGSTPLHDSVTQGNKDITSILLDNGADPNATSWLYGTPLTLSVEYMTEVGKILLSRGGDPTMAGRYGRSAIDWCDTYPMLEQDMQLSRSQFPPTPDDEVHRRLKQRLHTIIYNGLSSNLGVRNFSVLGHTLIFLKDLEDAQIAFQQYTVRSRNYITHGESCLGCKEEDFTGSWFVCQVCARTNLCLECLSKHPAFERTVLAQFRKISTVNDEARDLPWVDFLAINGLSYLRYTVEAELETRSQAEFDIAIIRRLREAISSVDFDLKDRIPWCTEEHTFLHVPGPDWHRLAPGTVNSKGQSFREWLQALGDIYPLEESSRV